MKLYNCGEHSNEKQMHFGVLLELLLYLYFETGKVGIMPEYVYTRTNLQSLQTYNAADTHRTGEHQSTTGAPRAER